MATEVLRPHNILQPQTQRIRAAHRRPSSNPGATRRSPPPSATAAPTTGRRHHGRPSSSSSSYGKVTSAAAPARRPAVEVYAGPAFSAASPEPSSLPLPQFPLQKPAAAVNDAATRDLRRMLRLE